MTVIELNNILGRNIKLYRKLKGWTLRQLGEKLGMSFAQAANWEYGKNLIGGKNLIALSGVFGVEPWEMFYPHTEKAFKQAVKRAVEGANIGDQNEQNL